MLYLAEQVKVYFPPSEIPAMLDAFLPLVTQSVRSILFLVSLCQHLTPLVYSRYGSRHNFFPSAI
jgi:hypothetical protein